MMQKHFSLPTRLAGFGFFLSLGLVAISLTVDFLHQNAATGLLGLARLYGNNPVQWIILTSPVFLTSVFYFLGKGIQSRELKLEFRARYEEEQFRIVERYIETLEAGNFLYQLPENFANQSLAKQLDQFRVNLIATRETEQLRLWEKEGLTQFSDLIHSTQDVRRLSEEVIRFLVKYTGCIQGAVYVTKDNEAEPYLERIACYAYDRKKFGEHVIPIGQGQVGQCYLEKETIMLYDIPGNYIRITSGLGEATPGFIAIVPIKTEGRVNGIIELAAFEKLSSQRVSFLEKACDAFGLVLHAVITAEHVKLLLDQSQQQMEELRSQEEEMRQNMEELQAVQEQMSRQQEETLRVKTQLEAREKVLGHTTILSEADLYGTITFVNSKFCEVSQYKREELIGKGHNILRHPDMPKEIFKQMWSTIKGGGVFRGIVKNRKKDGSHYWVDATIVPIVENGKIIKYIGARYHIQDEQLAQKLFDEQKERIELLRTPSYN